MVSEYLEYTNRQGVSVRFGGSSKYGLVSVEGLGDVGADIQLQSAPYQDGGTFIDAVLNSRFIPIEFIICDVNYAEIRKKRADLSRILNPKLGLGTLKYVSGDLVRIIDAVAESVPIFPDGNARGERWQRGTLTFVAPNPYWRSLAITEEPAFEPRFKFPFSGPFIMGVQRDQRIIRNDGDAPAPLYVEFFGPANNPMITNQTTGEYIRVNRPIPEDSYLRIDTSNSRKRVELVASDGTVTNVFNWIDLGSTFFSLAVGDNEISYSADSDIQNVVVNVRYSKLYNAI